MSSPSTSTFASASDTLEPSPASEFGRWLLRHWMWGVVLAAGVYLVWQVYPLHGASETGPMAPDFELIALGGEPFRLSAHRGEVVVLNIWATWCPPCRMEIPGFVELQDELRDEGVTFVGLSVDDEGFAAVRPFAEEYGMNYPQLVGPGVADRLYGPSRTIPRTYVIDRQGRIRYEHTGLIMKGALEPILRDLAAEPYPASSR